MKYKFLTLVAFLFIGAQASQALTEQSFNSSSTGTTSATAFVPTGNAIGEIRDLSYRLDSGVTTGFIGQYVGQRKYAVTSSTASAASVIYITNADSGVGAGEFVIYLDADVGTYYLRRVSSATTTSVTLASSIAITTATADSLWSCAPTVERAVSAVSQTGGQVSIWIPANVPAAMVIDGNTTSCRISLSGARGARN